MCLEGVVVRVGDCGERLDLRAWHVLGAWPAEAAHFQPQNLPVIRTRDDDGNRANGPACSAAGETAPPPPPCKYIVSGARCPRGNDSCPFAHPPPAEAAALRQAHVAKVAAARRARALAAIASSGAASADDTTAAATLPPPADVHIEPKHKRAPLFVDFLVATFGAAALSAGRFVSWLVFDCLLFFIKILFLLNF